MFWYLLNIGIIILTWFLPVRTSGSNELIRKIRNKRTCIVASINWIILSGLRALCIGADTGAYKISYDKIHETHWIELFTSFINKYQGLENIKDPGYASFVKLTQILVYNYQIYLIIIACIFFCPLGLLIYRNSKNACLSYIIFSTIFYSFFAITGIRQTLATAIVFCFGYELITQRKLFSYTTLIIVASSIHSSVFVFFPFYWISHIKVTSRVCVCYWIAIILAFALKNKLLAFMQFIGGYEDYNQFEGAGAFTFTVLLLLIGIYVTIYQKALKPLENYTVNASINAVYLACIFSSLLTINPSLMRVVQYYSIFLLFLVPQIIKTGKTYRDKIILYFVMLVLPIILLVKNAPQYYFFWQWQ